MTSAPCQTFSIPSGTGNKDYTISGIGTVVGVFVELIGADTDPGASDDEVLCRGFADGTTQVYVASCAAGDPNTAINARQTTRSGTDAIIKTLEFSGGGAAVDAHIDFVEFIDDGVRLNTVQEPNSSSEALQITFLVEPDCQVEVKTVDISAAGSATVTPSFPTEALICIYNGKGGADWLNDANESHLLAGIGFATKDSGGSITQRTVCFRDEDVSSGNTRRQSVISSNDIARRLDGSAQGNRLTISSWDEVSFDVDHNDESDGEGAFGAAFLCIGWHGTRQAQCFEIATPTTGTVPFDQDHAIGFENDELHADSILAILSQHNTSNGYGSGTLVSCHGTGRGDGTRTIQALIRQRHNRVTSVATSYKGTAWRTRKNGGGEAVVCTVANFNTADNVTLNYTKRLGAVRRWPALAISERFRKPPDLPYTPARLTEPIDEDAEAESAILDQFA